MKKLILLFIIASSAIHSQNADTGPELKYSDEKFFDRSVGYDKNGFYTLRFNTEGKGRNYFLMCYNRSTLDKIKSIPLGQRFTEYDIDNYSIKPGIPTKVILNCFVKDGKYIEYSQIFYEEKGLLQLVLNIFNTISGEQLVTDKLLGETSSNVMGMYTGKYRIIPNYDSTKVLLVLRTSENGNPVANCQLTTIDASLKTWEKKITGIGATIVSNCYETDENENLYYFYLQKNSNDQVINSGLAVIMKNETQSKILADKLATTGSIYNPSLTFIKEDNAVYCFYNTANEVKAGLYYAKIKNSKVEFSSNYQYPDRIMAKFFCPTSINQKERNSFTPIKIFKINDSYFLTNYITYFYSGESGRSRYSENINVCKINSSGNIDWHTVLPHGGFTTLAKNLDHNELGEMSVFTQNNKLNFVFIDHPKNEKNNPDPNNFDVCKVKEIGTFPNTNVMMLSVDNKGIISSKNLLLNDDNWFFPGLPILKNTEGNLILRGKSGKAELFKVVK